MWLDENTPEAEYSEYLELDLSTVVPSIAGPKRPQDRIELASAKEQFRKDLHNYSDGEIKGAVKASAPSWPQTTTSPARATASPPLTALKVARAPRLPSLPRRAASTRSTTVWSLSLPSPLVPTPPTRRS